MTKQDFIKSVYFDEATYLEAKAASLNAQNVDGGGWNSTSVGQAIASIGMTAWDHYNTFGAFERDAEGDLGINPGSLFDQNAYYEDKVEQLRARNELYTKEQVASVFQQAGFSPLTHYASVGYTEWVFPTIQNMNYFPFSGGTTPVNFSGDYRIDSLSGTNADWYSCNALGASQGNVLYYTFPTNPKEEVPSPQLDPLQNVSAFNAEQQEGVYVALAMLSAITGITFVQTNTTSQANLLFFSGINPTYGTNIVAYSEWIDNLHNVLVMNTTDFPEMNDLRFGTKQEQFLTVLHEVGHALGLKHPFDTEDGPYTLPLNEDNYAYTLMSYTAPDSENDWYSPTNSDNYPSPYDIAALQWIYGTDGLNGFEGQIYTGA